MTVWKEFKLLVTDPPKYAGHFEMIKRELIPFVDKHSFAFWITNYFNSTSDFILFRIKCEQDQTKLMENFLDDLKKRHLIADWKLSTWDSRKDAQNRIDKLHRIGFDPNKNRIAGFNTSNNKIVISPDKNVGERQKQLASLFEALGECTKAVYSHLGTKPRDLWIMSVFIHLLLNSIDYSGPNPGTEENWIRNIPPY